MDFIAYLLFILAGWMIGGILVYPVWKYITKLDRGSEKKGLVGAVVAAVLAVFGASR